MMARVLRTWAADAAEFATMLARHDPAWCSATFELAGGHVVLWGPGMFLNAGLAVGLDGPLGYGGFDRIERGSRAVGVDASIEISPATDPAVRAVAVDRGYVPGGTRAALRRPLDDVDVFPAPLPAVTIEPGGGARLATSQTVSALGFGHDTPGRRRASDAFAAVAAKVDGDRFVLATDTVSGDPIACATLSIRDDVATLGGMSTVPSARRRGVQSALIRHRLALAASSGCAIATTTVAPGGDSERNLLRHGFDHWFTIETLTRPTTTGS